MLGSCFRTKELLHKRTFPVVASSSLTGHSLTDVAKQYVAGSCFEADGNHAKSITGAPCFRVSLGVPLEPVSCDSDSNPAGTGPLRQVHQHTINCLTEKDILWKVEELQRMILALGYETGSIWRATRILSLPLSNLNPVWRTFLHTARNSRRWWSSRRV